MRGLTIVVAAADPERFRAALAMAGAQAALGGRARMFVQGGAVAVLRPPVAAPADAAHAAAGQPGLAALLDEALALGVEIVACQSGLDVSRIDVRALDRRIAVGGLVGVMATLGDDRLVAF